MDICILPLITTVIQLVIGTLWGIFLKDYESNFYMLMLQTFLTTFLSIGVPCYIYMKIKKKPFFSDFSNGVKANSLFVHAVILGVFGQFTGVLANLPVSTIYLQFKSEIPSVVPQINNLKELAIGVFAMCIAPALFEEILFRGIIFNHFRRFGSSAAIIISAFLFALVHYSALNFLGPLVLGLIFGIITAKTHRLIYPVIAHFSVNLTALLLTYASGFELYETNAVAITFAAVIVSVPIVIHVVNKFKAIKDPLPYSEVYPIEIISEKEFKTETGDTVKIILHQPDEKMLYLAFRSLFMKPYIYIILAFFVFTTVFEFMF